MPRDRSTFAGLSRSRGAPIVSAAHLSLLGLAACAASATFDGALYRGRDVAFRVSSVPASWHRVSLAVADLAFRDEAHDASVLVNSRCFASDRDAPLVALTDHLILGTTARKISREEIIPFDGREAQHTVLEARLDGVPMEYDIFVLKKDGCVFDFVYITPPGDTGAAAGTVQFEEFVRGFHTVSPTGAVSAAGAGPARRAGANAG